MTEEELIKNQFPNDEFLQSGVSQIVDKCTADFEQKLEIERSSRIALVNKIVELEKENAELRDDNKVMADNYSKMEQKFYDNLTKAKEIIEELYNIIPASMSGYAKEPMEHARKFMTEEGDK